MAKDWGTADNDMMDRFPKLREAREKEEKEETSGESLPDRQP